MSRTPTSLQQRRHYRNAANLQAASKVHQKRYPANTLGPNEDIIQKRKDIHRKRAATHSAPLRSRSVLVFHIFLLVFLLISTWGIYSLAIYFFTR